LPMDGPKDRKDWTLCNPKKRTKYLRKRSQEKVVHPIRTPEQTQPGVDIKDGDAALGFALARGGVDGFSRESKEQAEVSRKEKGGTGQDGGPAGSNPPRHGTAILKKSEKFKQLHKVVWGKKHGIATKCQHLICVWNCKHEGLACKEGAIRNSRGSALTFVRGDRSNKGGAKKKQTQEVNKGSHPKNCKRAQTKQGTPVNAENRS